MNKTVPGWLVTTGSLVDPRPGDQIDRGIDPRQVPSALPSVYNPAASTQRPGPILRGVDDFFAQGLNVGLELRY